MEGAFGVSTAEEDDGNNVFFNGRLFILIIGATENDTTGQIVQTYIASNNIRFSRERQGRLVAAILRGKSKESESAKTRKRWSP